MSKQQKGKCDPDRLAGFPLPPKAFKYIEDRRCNPEKNDPCRETFLAMDACVGNGGPCVCGDQIDAFLTNQTQTRFFYTNYHV